LGKLCSNPYKNHKNGEKKDTKKEEFTLIIRFKVVKFFVSPRKNRQNTEANSIKNPPFLFGTAFNIEYWHRKYHSGTMCRGVKKAQASKALSGWLNVDIPKWH